MRLIIKILEDDPKNRFPRHIKSLKSQNKHNYKDYCSIDVPDSISVLKLKRQIRDQKGFIQTTKDFHLYFGNLELLDSKNLNEYGIEEGDVLIISIDILPGGPEPENKYYSTNINAVNKRGNIGEEFFYLIIGSEEGTVWGDKIYTDDSNIAKAAVLEGKCELGEEAFLGIKMIEGKSSYSSSSKNGINSSSWGSWPASYIFI